MALVINVEKTVYCKKNVARIVTRKNNRLAIVVIFAMIFNKFLFKREVSIN